MAGQSWYWLEFVETLAFTRKLYQIADDRTFQAIQSQFVENQERWPIVAGTGGAGKDVWAIRPPRVVSGGVFATTTS